MLPDLVRFSVKARKQDLKVLSAEFLMSTHYKKKIRKVDQTKSTCVVWRWCQGLTEGKAASVSASPSLPPPLTCTHGPSQSHVKPWGDPASGSPPLSHRIAVLKPRL